MCVFGVRTSLLFVALQSLGLQLQRRGPRRPWVNSSEDTLGVHTLRRAVELLGAGEEGADHLVGHKVEHHAAHAGVEGAAEL